MKLARLLAVGEKLSCLSNGSRCVVVVVDVQGFNDGAGSTILMACTIAWRCLRGWMFHLARLSR